MTRPTSKTQQPPSAAQSLSADILHKHGSRSSSPAGVLVGWEPAELKARRRTRQGATPRPRYQLRQLALKAVPIQGAMQ